MFNLVNYGNAEYHTNDAATVYLRLTLKMTFEMSASLEYCIQDY